MAGVTARWPRSRPEYRPARSGLDFAHRRPRNNESTPLVHGDMMYLTGPSNNAWAVDLLTGRKSGAIRTTRPQDWACAAAPVNRGFAMLGDRLFKVNIQSTLVALDAKTGKVLWETTVDDYKKGYHVDRRATHCQRHGRHRHRRRGVGNSRLHRRL